MKNMISFEKLSKKEQRRINNEKRSGWNGINPVTRIVTDATKYTRKTKHKSSYVED